MKTFGTTVLAIFIALIFSSYAHSQDMKNIHMTHYNDHMFLFYQCGDYAYFNHEIRSQRVDRGGTLNFSWMVNQTLIGLMYCDGFGKSLFGEKIANSAIQTAVTPKKLYAFFQPKSNPSRIKFAYHGTRLSRYPDGKKWKQKKWLRDNRGNYISAQSFAVTEYAGDFFVTYVQSGSLKVRRPDGRVFSVSLPDRLSTEFPIKATSVYTRQGPQLMILWAERFNKTYNLTVVDYHDLKSGQISKQTRELRLFQKADRSKSVELKGELSGHAYLLVGENKGRGKVRIDVDDLSVKQFDWGVDYNHPWNERAESKAYSHFQIPLACKPSTDCTLVNMAYPIRSNFIRSPSNLIHGSYGGKVVIEPLHQFPVEHNKLELVGIIEGPPPVPLENILASFKVLPAEFVLDAARKLSRFIKTNISQTLLLNNTKSQEEINTTVHGLSMQGSIPTVLPINIGGAMEASRSLLTENITEKQTTIKETYTNEIQHASRGSGNDLIMKPTGKLIYLKYDVKAFRYVFKDEDDKVNSNGPVLYSMGKTNIRPVIRQYEILGRQVNPRKYSNHIIVGKLETYHNMHRRVALMRRAAELAPGYKYLSYTYNNVLDLSTHVNIHTSKTTRNAVTDSFTSEFMAGFGGEGSPIPLSAQYSFKETQERTYSVSNQVSNGMAINVDMNFVVPVEDERVMFYDFEVYYLSPEKENLDELMEELRDTARVSNVNRKALEEINPKSKPWKVTYSVSDIRKAADHKEEGGDVDHGGLPLGNNRPYRP